MLHGIQDVNLAWFKSYLSNRKQCVKFKNTKTEYELITCGVPQGSILEPLLFLIYINDLQNASTILKFILFADDTNIFLSDKDIKTLFCTLNSELKKVNQWLLYNRLTLNVDKTKYTL